MFSDTFRFKFLAYHESSDVLEEEQRNFTLRAHLNEVSSLLSRFREEYSLVGDNTNRVSIEVSESSQQSGAVPLLKLMEPTSIEHSRQDSLHIDISLMIDTNNSIEFIS